VSDPVAPLRLDAIVTGARVHRTPGQAVAGDAIGIRDGRIVAIDAASALRDHVGPATRRIDVAGALVLPAFIDAHTHLHRWAVLRRCYLDFEADRPADLAAVLEAVAARAATTPAGAWIQGDGLSASRLAEARLPDRRELDAVAPAHPIVLRGIGKHVVAANSAALAAAGIDRTTPDPPGGRIERDDDGEPTGILHERAKLRLDQSSPDTVVPSPDADLRQAALRDAYGELHRAGITTIHEMVRLPEEAGDHAALRARGALGARIRLYYRVHESPLSLDWLLALAVRHGMGDDLLRVLGVKISIDGFCIFRNAAVSVPYLGEPENRGILRIEPERLDALVTRAAGGGLQVAVHAVGDRAVDLALDAFEGAGPRPAGDPPFRLEHGYVDLGAERLRRMRRLGVVWSTQANFLDAYRREWQAAFEPERIERIMPLADGLAAGVPLVLDSDVPCAPFAPLDAIRAAVERRTADGAPHPQAIGVVDAWRAYTTTPADVTCEPSLGRLEPGAHADLLVLDGDPFRGAPGATALDGVAVRATMLGGSLVWGEDRVGG
jgi:predicted amidohydrolase YtcJ